MISNRRRSDVNGRSRESKGHVRLYHWVLACDAWTELKPSEVRVLIELYGLFNGRNNGELFLSCREAAKRCRINKDTANKAFKRLIELGFIKRRWQEPLDFSLRKANRWILTEFEFGGAGATKEFVRWKPCEKEKTASPKMG